MNPLPTLRRFAKRHVAVHTAFTLAVGLLGTTPPAMAADILRGGGGGSAPAGGATPATGLGDAAANVDAGRATANDVLARTTQAIQVMRNLQTAARDAAVNGPNHLGNNPNQPGQTLPDVPNGLISGGLEVDPGVATNPDLWKGAVSPTQSVTPTRTTVIVVQTAQQALLNWKTFNIGKATTLKFDQSAGGANQSQWIAFNKINDPTGNPTQILGSIEAPGQVYIINQNGIIFGGSSQVNTHTLVASALPINDNLVARGLLNNPDAQFLFSALAQSAGNKGPTPGFTPPPSVNGRSGDVTVQAGARISAPTSAANVGGRVALVGANVTNNGTISTPDGQTILAAGLQVGFVAHSSSDASLRGLDVYIGAVVDPLSVIPAYAGTATNSGVIEVARANVTLAGKEVKQTGAINSSTSVALNGRIDLQANYGAVSNAAYDAVLLPDVPAFLYKNTGSVSIGAGSVTQILPEWLSTDKIIGTELALRSQVNIRGRTIHLGEGATILAPNAWVSADAGVWDYVAGSSPRSYFVHAGGQIYLDPGAIINVAGSTDVNVPVTQHLITVQLLGSELANSPLQRDGVLRGQTITVDLRKTGMYNGKAWVGTPLADLSGYIGLIQRSVGELTVAGGSVNLNAGGSVVVRSGAEINTSGGWINYTGGNIATTKLISNGFIYDIADASPDLVYSGIYSGSSNRKDLKWAVNSSIDNPITPGESYYDPGYLFGANGGRLGITSAAVALNGSFIGRTVAGPTQRAATPLASEFALKFEAQELLASIYPIHSPTPPKVTFQGGLNQAEADAFAVDANGNPLGLRADRLADVYLSPELLTTNGFGRFSVENMDGDIVVGSGVTLNAAARGGIALVGANLDIQGSLIAPAGSITLKALNISPSDALAVLREVNPTAPLPNSGRGLITLGSSAVVSAAGLMIDDRAGAVDRLSKSLALQGGLVSINGYVANLSAGSIIDVTGGVVMNAQGKPSYGNAGSIDIKAGQDPTLPYVQGGKLTLGSTLLGYSGADGGSISVTAPLIQMGGTALHADSLMLQSSFFQTGGFAHFKIAGFGKVAGGAGDFIPGVYIAAGTIIEPVADSYIALPSQAGQGVKTQLYRKPVGLRSPTSIQFSAPGVEGLDGREVRGDLVLGEGAVIRTDPLGSVSLSGNTVAVLGSIYTPGGVISISGSSNSSTLLFDDPSQALTTVYIGSHSTLSAAGTTLLVPDAFNRRVGQVLAGGVISVSGNIAAASGAELNVSGSTGTLDLHPSVSNANVPYLAPGGSGATSQLYSLMTVATKVDSNGGNIILSGGQMLASDATLYGNAGGITAIGGSLSVTSGRFYLPNVIPPPLDSNLVVKQSGATIGTAFTDDATAIGQSLRGAGGEALIGRGYFAADKFAQSGMDSLSLNGVVEFSGPVTINAAGSLRVATGGVIHADGLVSLTASSVALGRAFAPPVRPEDRLSQMPFTDIASIYGAGRLVVNAKHLEVGTLTLQNIGSATLAADNGDIVGNGILTIAGNLTLRAGQIYTPTASEFTVVAYDYNTGTAQKGSITVQSSGLRQLPLSAGGTLSIYASTINQQGVLRVPIGTINLGWDGTGATPRELLTGSVLPFPVTSQLTLGAGSITSVSAVDPITGKGIVIPYGVSLDGSTWIDPRGVDITAGGLPQMIINISGANITMAASATVDLRGGGDLLAYRWVQGNGGTADILESSGSFAVLPDYQAGYAPYAPNNSLNSSANLIRNAGPGYINAGLKVGDRIYLAGSDTLAAGFYTLLPARYALLPGAVLVTPKSDVPVGTNRMPDGASLVSGYAYNDLNSARTLPTLASRFEVASAAVIAERAEYQILSANTFLKASALRLNIATPQLPQDSGYLLFQATQSMSLLGSVASQALTGANGAIVGRGASIDITAPVDIVISNAAGGSTPGVITLNSAALSAFGAESLLIGGKRTRDAAGTTIAVQSNNITVNNSGSTLTAPDLTLAAKGTITVAANASIASSGSVQGSAETFNISGNGSLIRVSQSEQAQVVRTNITSAAGPSLVIGSGSRIIGTSLTLDTTANTSLNSTALLSANVYSLNSGRISLVLSGGGALQPSPGLVLTGALLASLQTAKSLSLRSYSSIDIYGTGQVGHDTAASLTLSAGEIRGFNQGAGTVTFAAKQIVLDNVAGGSVVSTAPLLGNGKVVFNAETILLGANQLRINQFGSVTLNGLGGIQVRGTGSFSTQGALNLNAPLITGANAASHAFLADGALSLQMPANDLGDGISVGLGVNLTLQGSSVTASGTRIIVPSGTLNIRATNGNVSVNNRLDAGGTAQTFYDVVKYTSAGEVNLSATNGSVIINPNAVINVAAATAGGNAGSVGVSAPTGGLTNNGTLIGLPGAGGLGASFTLDVGALASLGALNAQLNSANFDFSRIFRVRSGNVLVDGSAKASTFRVSADQGSITVTGVVNASGATGGTIGLAANGSVTLSNGSVLNVAGQTFSNAGKGGVITLESGTERNGTVGTGSVDIQTGSTLNLSVASLVAGNESTIGSSAYSGQYAGKLHIRAPQNSAFNDVLVNAINGNIIGASSIVVEGYRLYDLTSSGGVMNTDLESTIHADSQAFLGVAGVTSANYTTMMNRLLGAAGAATRTALGSVFVLAPGAEIINRTGDLTLGSTSSNTTQDWDLSGFRYGEKSAAGVLTLRAAGNLNFHNSLSDGFAPTLNSSDATWLWLARLANQNVALPMNTQSWSFRLTAGADLTAADFRAVKAVTALGAGSGSLVLGKDGGTMIASGGDSALTSSVIGATTMGGGRGLFQVIRTGSGDIDISTGRSVQLLNQFASIYTAGTRVADISMGGTFDVPTPNTQAQNGGTGSLGAAQQGFPALYSAAGGNVSIATGENIERLGVSSSRELPNNWLYRRGYVYDGNEETLPGADVPVEGAFAKTGLGEGVASTTWWVDFSNFFEGVGALGGGNVTLNAGRNITNVDGLVPTNARMTKGTDVNPLAVNQRLLELGGGDLVVRAGNNIDAGVYYVERGRGTLYAGGQITTNATRSPGQISPITGANTVLDSNTWLPTTLFLGKGGFDVSARGNVLLGPVANPFLLPQGVNNSYWYKTYFSTYASDSFVNVSSLGGSLTLRTGAFVEGAVRPLLQAWASTQQLKSSTSSAVSQPWLRLAETDVTSFGIAASLMAPTLRATAYSGDINLQGNITLFPSATGTLDLLTRGHVNGLQPTGLVAPSPGNLFVAWGSSRITISDADPASVPSAASPYAYQNLVGTTQNTTTQANFLEFIDKSFRESGGTLGSQAILETKQALHASGLLHRNDLNPARIYAGGGDISGLTLFSPKATRVFAGRDIVDVGLYLQNISSKDVSIVASGRDIIPYNANTLLRVAANRSGNIAVETFSGAGAGALAGDIQISGPGTLQVLAGRNLDLGSGSNNADGTGAGITSIGNARNPFLPFEGANIIAAAGIGSATGLTNSNLNFTKFIADFVLGPNSAAYLKEVSTNPATPLTPAEFALLPVEEQKRLALEIFYLVLRDSGREHNNPDSDQFRTYATGEAAIAALFPGTEWGGDITTQARDIRTKNGGDILIFAPGGGLTLATTTIGSPLAPPGIITDAGGHISIFTHTSVNLGISRVFTLRGGNEIIWSSTGDIAAGSSSKTVQAAPPTRVIIDPQSGDVATDLAGLATGGGIGVLASVKGVAPGDVDLIAPLGTIDAGDAGIRSTGNFNAAANQVLNAGNIQAGGTSGGTPVAVSAPSLGGLTAAATASGTANTVASNQTGNQRPESVGGKGDLPSIITLEVIGYGGGEGDDEEDELRKKRKIKHSLPMKNETTSASSGAQ